MANPVWLVKDLEVISGGGTDADGGRQADGRNGGGEGDGERAWRMMVSRTAMLALLSLLVWLISMVPSIMCTVSRGGADAGYVHAWGVRGGGYIIV